MVSFIDSIYWKKGTPEIFHLYPLGVCRLPVGCLIVSLYTYRLKRKEIKGKKQKKQKLRNFFTCDRWFYEQLRGSVYLMEIL